ncbi:hypothetical protein HJFPF1_04643 [Paramyrothecium foliicola]|nr:hypothetical protein HJFPF1_04643 [Paramyrothecium foliicola]
MMVRLLLAGAGLLACLPSATAIEPVTISRDLPRGGHVCVTRCVYSTLVGDVATALGCALPYDNECFCATQSDAFIAASSHFEDCATLRCSAGDISRDVSSMKSIYASYCLGAGYTQPGATDWVPAGATTATGDDPQETGIGDNNGTEDPAPSQSDNSDPPARTSVQLTIVTQTTTDSAGSTVTQTFSVVIQQQTSTAWVNPDGSPAQPPGSSGGGDDSKWKIAVGVVVPVVVILAAVAAWLIWRRRRRAKQNPNPPAENFQHQTSPPPMTETPISRKPVASPAVSSLSQPTEIHGNSIRQELNPQGVDALPTAPPVYTGGMHEAAGQSTWPENHMVSPISEVSGAGQAPELPGAYERPRSELPGNNQFYRQN